MAIQTLADLRHQQAAAIAYLDIFWIAGALAIGLAFVTIFMKRSVAEKGEHVASE